MATAVNGGPSGAPGHTARIRNPTDTKELASTKYKRVAVAIGVRTKFANRPLITSRGFQAEAGYGEPRQRRLSGDEVAALARLLIDNAEGLPFNLYADQYTDLTIEVLNRKVSIQARRFAEMTPETHGARQQSFDRVIEVLAALQRQVAAEGRAAAP